MEVLIINSSSKRVPRKFLASWVRDCHREVSRKSEISWGRQGLCLQFLDPSEMKRINLRYRDRNAPTDVLSFGFADPNSLGELALCPQVIATQALDHGLPYRQELGYVVLHGILHLLGFEHEGSKAKARVMFELQDQVFEKLSLKWWPASTRERK